METNDQNQIKEQNNQKMELPMESLGSLNETRKWTAFLAILGFVFIGLLIILGFSINSIFSRFGGPEMGMQVPGIIFGGIYLIIGLIYFFPILYLYKFSDYTKKAIHASDASKLNQALKNLKAHFRYMGILAIIFIGLYVLIFAGMLIGGLATGFM